MLFPILGMDRSHPSLGMRPDEVDGLTGVLKPNVIYEIRCPIRLERPGGHRDLLQYSNLELQLFVGFGKLPCALRDPAIEFSCNPFLLIHSQCLLQPDCCLIRSYAKHQFLGLLRKTGSLRSGHDESELAIYSHSDGKDRNLLLSKMPEYFFRRLLRILSKRMIESLPNLLPAMARS